MLRFLKQSKKSLWFGWGSQYFRKNFILILFITFIPGLITGVGIYLFGVGKVEKDLTKLHENQIEQRANHINEQLDVLEMSIAHWAFEPRFRASLKEINFVKEFVIAREIKNLLLVLQGSNPLIKNVELYVDEEEPIVFTPNYHVITDETAKNFYQNILSKKASINWIEQIPSKQKKDFSNPSIMLTHNIGYKTPYGTIIVTLDQSKFTELLNSLTPYPKGATFLFNENNRILAEKNNSNSSTIVSVLQKEVNKRKKGNGSFTFEYEGERYSVSYGTQKRIHSKWTYVSAAPMSFITSPMVFISKLIMIISAAGLLLAFFMTWFASQKIYSPVAKLVNLFDKDEVRELGRQRAKDEFSIIEQQIQELSKDSQSLQEQLSAQIPQLKKSFLLQLIQGFLFNYSEQQLRERLNSYGWNLDDHLFIMLDIRGTGNYESERRFLNNDERLIAYAVTNIMEEAAQEKFDQFNMIDYHDLSVGMLIVYPSHKDIRPDIHDYIEQIVESINRTLHMQVTATISKPTENVKRIPHIFEEVRQGTLYRNYKNHNQIIDLQEVKKEDTVYQIFYPFDIEKEIIQAIRMGQLEEVERLIYEFLKEISEKGINEINIQPGIVQLFCSIQHEIIHSGIHPYELFQGKNMFDELSQIQEPKMIVTWFTTKVIAPFIQMLEGRIDFELKQLVDQVILDIHDNYMKDISLENYADQVGTNPYTLSKYFKKIIGINFIDYITKLRIDKAKELLLKTDMKINDISEQVGYRQSYFNRIFKKQVGVPPSQYRKVR